MAARALERALVLPARSDLLEISAIVEPLDRGDARVLEVAVERDADDLAAILQRRQRGEPDRLEPGVPGDRSERALANAAEGAQRHFLAKRRLRHRREHPRVRERLDRGEAFRFGDAFERVEGDIPQHRQRLVPDIRIGIGFCHRRQRGRIHQLGHSRASHPSIHIVPGNLGEQVALVDRDFLYVGQADDGIGMLLGRLCAESIEQGHNALRPDHVILVKTHDS